MSEIDDSFFETTLTDIKKLQNYTHKIKTVKEMFFYVMSPLYFMKSQFSVIGIDLKSRRLSETRKMDKVNEKKSLIVRDITYDFGTIKGSSYLLHRLWG